MIRTSNVFDAFIMLLTICEKCQDARPRKSNMYDT